MKHTILVTFMAVLLLTTFTLSAQDTYPDITTQEPNCDTINKITSQYGHLPLFDSQTVISFFSGLCTPATPEFPLTFSGVGEQLLSAFTLEPGLYDFKITSEGPHFFFKDEYSEPNGCFKGRFEPPTRRRVLETCTIYLTFTNVSATHRWELIVEPS